MDHTDHAHHSGIGQTHSGHHAAPESLNYTALVATLHCLLGCAIGEVVGLFVGSALGWSNAATIALAVVLAFTSGFALTAIPFLRRGFALKAAVRIALAADAASITIMEVVDNAFMLIMPGAMNAPIDSLHFWGSMAASLAIAGIAAYPANRWLIDRGRGHAVAHAQH